MDHVPRAGLGAGAWPVPFPPAAWVVPLVKELVRKGGPGGDLRVAGHGGSATLGRALLWPTWREAPLETCSPGPLTTGSRRTR